MTQIFDIFFIEAGGPVWLEAASTLEEATARAVAHAMLIPGEYLILNQSSGHTVTLELGRGGSSKPSDLD